MKALRALPVFLLLFTVATAGDRRPAQNCPLVNQDGKPFQLYDFKGKPVLLSFIYSRCPFPNMCPMTMSLNRRLIEDLKKKKKAGSLRILLVTLEPNYDTAAVLKDFGKRHHIDFKYATLATGDPTTLEDFAFTMRTTTKPDSGFIAHNMKTILLDKEMVPIAEFDDNKWSTDAVLKALLR